MVKMIQIKYVKPQVLVELVAGGLEGRSFLMIRSPSKPPPAHSPQSICYSLKSHTHTHTRMKHRLALKLNQVGFCFCISLRSQRVGQKSKLINVIIHQHRKEESWDPQMTDGLGKLILINQSISTGQVDGMIDGVDEFLWTHPSSFL